MITEKQNQVYEEVKKLLSEHFDNYVFIVEAEIINPDNQEMATYWQGSYQGHSCSIGLLEKQKSEMLKEVISL